MLRTCLSSKSRSNRNDRCVYCFDVKKEEREKAIKSLYSSYLLLEYTKNKEKDKIETAFSQIFTTVNISIPRNFVIIMVIVKSVPRVKSINHLKKYNFKKETLVCAMHSKNVR